MALTGKMIADALFEFGGREQAVRIKHAATGMEPARLNRIEPGALDGQEAGQDANATTSRLDLLVVSANPGAHVLGEVPGGIVPDQEPEAFAEVGESGGGPVEELGGDGTDRAATDKAEPDLLWQGG